jgi:alkyldihydroxyacetonephosphate synthase
MAGAATDRRKHWGWGSESAQLTRAQLTEAAPGIRDRLGFGGDDVEEPVALEAIELPKRRAEPPESLAEICRSDSYERVAHALGKAYRDVVRGFRGQIEFPPDVVAHPRDEREVEAVLAWCSEAKLAAIPYGGGTSVVGGVEPRLGGEYAGAVSINLRALDQVLEVDETSRAARIQAGILGPDLEDQLRPTGLTLRHFPQSFEFSTLGGWVATRAGGHYATRLTHIDDLVESVRAITPAGTWESRRLPGSGAGPSPDRLMLGSEGTLGIITEAWVRLQERPTQKLSVGVSFPDFLAGAEAVRALAQSGLDPSNCRLLDPAEAALTHAATDGMAMLVLGFESAHHPVDEDMRYAVETAKGFGGVPGEVKGGATPQPRRGGLRAAPPPGEEGSDPVGSWRHAFLAAPYLRDTFVALGVLSDTFETAITWDRFEDFHATVSETARRAIAEICGIAPNGHGSPVLGCRFTHVYPDGPAAYYTVICPAKRGGEVEQWDEVKAAVSEAVISAGGTITHHHAVGRDHRPWYDRQRPEPFAQALRAAKRALDPAGVLNPGVLIDPAP